MRRLILGLILFALILGAGVIWTATPGTDAAYAEAEARIQAAIEEDARILRLSGIGNLGRIPPEITSIPDLVQLDLRDTAVSDLTPLAGLKKLRILSLRGTLVQDLDPIEELTELDILDLSKTWVGDLEPLTKLPRLRRLDIGATLIDTLEPATRFPALDWINLHATSARDGSKNHLETLTQGGVTTNNARSIADDHTPGLLERLSMRIDRLVRRVRLGLLAAA